MIAQFLKVCPKKSGCFTRKIKLDDDTTAPADLKEDKRPDNKGRLPKHLAGIIVLAGPTHRKRTWRNRFYSLLTLKQKKCNVMKIKVKEMVKYIGYWIAQAKVLTFPELERNVEVPLNYWCGNHSLCGKWCYLKKSEQEGKCNNKKPLFDVGNESGKKH